MTRNAAVLGVGAYIPDEVRTNDWWPKAVVDSWSRHREKDVLAPRQEVDRPLKDTSTAELIAKFSDDPFSGAKERRVAPAHMLPSEMELLACKQALESARVSPEQIDLLLVFSLPQDTIVIPNSFKLHHALGLKDARCMNVSALCNSPVMMMELAQHYISAGTANRALIVTSTKYSALMDYTSSVSAVAGDGAGAVVMGPCPEGKGVLFSRQFVESQYHDSMLILRRPPLRPEMTAFSFGENQSVEKIYFTITKPDLARQASCSVPNWAARLREEVLVKAGFGPEDVKLMVPYCAFPWMGEVFARGLGIPMDRVEDNVLRFSNVGSATILLNLYEAHRKGRIKDGDLVMLVGQGGVMNYSGMLLRWYEP